MATEITDPFKKKEDSPVDPIKNDAATGSSDPLDFSQFKEPAPGAASAGTPANEPTGQVSPTPTVDQSHGQGQPSSAVDNVKNSTANETAKADIQVEPTGTADEKERAKQLADAEHEYNMSNAGISARQQEEREKDREKRQEQRTLESEARAAREHDRREQNSIAEYNRRRELDAVEAKIKAYNARISSTGWSSSILGSGSGFNNLFRGLDMTVRGQRTNIGGLYKYQQELLNTKANYMPATSSTSASTSGTGSGSGDTQKKPEKNPNGTVMVLTRKNDGTAKISGKGTVTTNDVASFAKNAGLGDAGEGYKYVYNKKTGEIYKKKKDEALK